MTEDLFTEGQPDDLGAQKIRRRAARVDTDTHRLIGCPLWWFTLVYPAVRGKGELAVALYLYRLQVVQRSRTVKVSNERLSAELGIDRFTKYRALRQLEAANIITVKRHNKRALEVVFKRKYTRVPHETV
jgi:CRP-like cAMP-binding protein